MPSTTKTVLSRFTGLAASAALAGMAACGGGGAPVAAGPTIEPILAPAEPSYAAIGLTGTPGKLIDNSNADTRQLALRVFANELGFALAAAPLADAAASFASIGPGGSPVDGTFPCPGGGSLTVAGTGYTYAACRVTGRGGDSYAIDGTATLVTAGTTYKLSFDHHLQVTPQGGTALRFPPEVPSVAECTVGGNCLVTVQPMVVNLQRFQFGTNSIYKAIDGATGTYGCGCDASQTWYVSVDHLTQTAGTAFIKAGNGTAKLRRKSATAWDAVITLDGVDYPLTID